MFLDHTQRRSTVGRTPLDEWSARRRDLYLTTHDTHSGRAARLLRSWVRIPPGAWIFVCCECRVLSSRGLCDELITPPEESYRLSCVIVCDLETSRMGAPYIYDISRLRVNNRYRGTRLCSRLRHCATSRKVAGSIPWCYHCNSFHWHNFSLGSTQPITKMSTRNISWGVKAAGV